MVEHHIAVQVGSGQRIRMDVVPEVLGVTEHTRSPFIHSEPPIETCTASPRPIRRVEPVRLGCGAPGPDIPLSATCRGSFPLGDEPRHYGATDLVERNETVVRGAVGFLDKVWRACSVSAIQSRRATRKSTQT